MKGDAKHVSVALFIQKTSLQQAVTPSSGTAIGDGRKENGVFIDRKEEGLVGVAEGDAS